MAKEVVDLTTREGILAAARELAGQRPWAQVTMAEIAERAGTSRQTVYRLAGDKVQIGAALGESDPGLPAGAADSRSRLLAAAARVFARSGYAGATVDEISAEAGLTKGAVYWHFSSKLELFLALLDGRLVAQERTLPGRVAGLAGLEDRLQGVAQMLDSMLSFAQSDPNWPRLYLEFLAQTREPEVQQRLMESTRRFREFTTGLTRQLQTQGYLAPDLDPAAVALVWSAILDGLILAWLADPNRVDLAAISPQIARILGFGLFPR